MGLYNESLNQNIDNLQVNGKIGNGSGGSKRTVDVLLPLLVSGYRGSHQIAKGNIEDYDEFYVVFGNENDFNADGYKVSSSFTSGMLSACNKIMGFAEWGQRSCVYEFNGSTVRFVTNVAEQEARNPYIMYMEGIKYE